MRKFDWANRKGGADEEGETRIEVAAMLVCVAMLGFAGGCATTRTSDTQRTGIEQLLISNAVDQALAKVDFGSFQGRSVFVQEKYLDGVDKNYIAATLRHRVLSSGAKLADKDSDADIIMEVRSGGVGTDRSESFIGVPQVATPGPLPLQIPEIQLVTSKTQTATAKIGIVAYDARTKQSIGDGGVSLARSVDNNWFMFGVGPYNSGQVKEEVGVATGRGAISLQLARYIPMGARGNDAADGPLVDFAPAQPPLPAFPQPSPPNVEAGAIPPSSATQARNPYAPGGTVWPR